MRVIEFKNLQGFALGITDAPASIEQAQQSLHEVKESLVAWKAKHGSQCQLVIFTYLCDETLHGPLENLLRAAYSDKQQLATLLQSIPTQVNLLANSGNNAGKKLREFTLTSPSASSLPTAKPWWKLW
jgi:hypothetical protein